MYKGKQLEFLKESNYILSGETVEDRINSIISVVKRYEKDYSEGLADRVRDLIEKKVLVLSTPQLSNLGRESNGNTTPLPCSCNIVSVKNSIEGISYSYGETAMLSKLGAGVGLNYDQVYDGGTRLSEGFESNQKLDWIEDAVGIAQKVSQQATRQGYAVPFLDIESKEIDDLLDRISRNNPNKNDPLVDNNVGINIGDSFIEKLNKGDREARKRIIKVLQIRRQTGKAYIVFTGNTNINKSKVYESQGANPSLLNICVEATTPHYDDKTFSCILSSLNLNKWDWIKENPQAIKDAYMFLDINVSEYIRLTEGVPFLEKARRSAIEKRDIGLSVLGFHDYIQSKGCAFGDVQSRILNKSIFSTIRKYVDEMNESLANKLGACPMAEEVGLNMRNVSQMMVAPHKSTAFISGEESTNPNGLSGGINPLMSNLFVQDLKGIVTTNKNLRLESLLKERGKNTPEVWKSISDNRGSVQHLDFLSREEKDVFKTFSEISPKDIIDLASDRQKYIDMSQSLNLINRPNYKTQDIYDIHMYAHEKGIKSLYYFYPQAHAVREVDGDNWDDCISCQD